MALPKFATGKQYRVAVVPETTFNVTPATPQLVELPKATFTPTPTKELMTANNITSTGLQEEDRHGNISIAGELTGDLIHGLYDDLFAAAFGNAWNGNVLRNGNPTGQALPSFTFEKGNVAFGKYERYTGVRVNSLAFTVEPGSISGVTIGLMGAGATTATTPLDPTVPITGEGRAMSHIGGNITMGGVAATFTSFTIGLGNGLEAAFGIGSATAVEIGNADSEITFSGTAYVASNDNVFDSFLNETTMEISLNLVDGMGNGYTLNIPKAKINAADRPVSGKGFQFVNFSGKGYRSGDYSLEMIRTTAA